MTRRNAAEHNIEEATVRLLERHKAKQCCDGSGIRFDGGPCEGPVGPPMAKAPRPLLTPQEEVDRDSRARAAAIDRARGEWEFGRVHLVEPLRALLAESPDGLGTEQLQERLEAAPMAVGGALSVLIDGGELRTRGTRRHPIYVLVPRGIDAE